MTQATLFAKCPLPGCREITSDPREPCPGCLEAFGGRLRPSGREVSAEEFAAELADGARAVAAILAGRRTWLSPVCVITPRRYRNHTACDYSLCTCGCHKRKQLGEDRNHD